MRKQLLTAMDELMHRNCICSYLIKSNSFTTFLNKIHTIDAYMKAIKIYQKNHEDVECYMAVNGNPAVCPVLEIKKGKIYLSGSFVCDVENDIIIETKNGFECTDDDCMQYGKYLGDKKYLFIQALWLDTVGNVDTYSVVADTIDVSEMSKEAIECAICGYYDSIEDMEQKNEAALEDLDWLVAECEFESNLTWEYGSEIVTEKRAKEIIQEFIDSDGKVFLNK